MINLVDHILETPDFPKPGVSFKDISPILSSPELFKEACAQMVRHVSMAEVDVVIGIESRGFILGAAIAAFNGKGFVPMRKAGKLPPPVKAMAYALEYGEATLELRVGKGRALIVDDVLATGGTLQAAIDLSKHCGYSVVDLSVLINLRFLNKMTFNDHPISAPIEY